MKYGIYLASVGDYCDASLLATLAREAEGCGWEGVFIWDHISQPNAAADPWVALTAMAAATERVKLGTIVTPVARRRPWKLARETVTLDRFSKGRLILGVGLGWGKAEFETFGEAGDPKVRAEKLDEGLEVLTGLWSGEPFCYSGKHYQIKEAQFLPKPLQSPRIPIWVCAAWPGIKAPFKRAARWDGVVAVPGSPDRPIWPNEIQEVRSYIQQHRISDEPFEVVIMHWSDGSHTVDEQHEVEQYVEAGATWWLEDLTPGRFATLEQVRERLRKGPPGI